MKRAVSIITVCKGRLDHLKLSLPSMVAQNCEVVVVDFSCPERAGEFVKRNFPGVKVVEVRGQATFSNWRARNAGAEAASSEILLFVDADTILAKGAAEDIAKKLPENAYGYCPRETSRAFNSKGERLAGNQLLGFQAVPKASFDQVGGYDDVLEGYASGADTDLEERLRQIGLAGHALDRDIVDAVLDHDTSSRVKFHTLSIRHSYAAGLLYRAAKSAMLRLRGEPQMPLALRRKLYAAAQQASLQLGSGESRASMRIGVEKQPVLMPRQLGHERGTQTVSLQVEVVLEDEIRSIPL